MKICYTCFYLLIVFCSFNNELCTDEQEDNIHRTTQFITSKQQKLHTNLQDSKYERIINIKEEDFKAALKYILNSSNDDLDVGDLCYSKLDFRKRKGSYSY